MRLSRFGSALLTCAALSCSTAQAAEQVEEVVVTGTRTAEQLRDFAGSISVVTTENVARPTADTAHHGWRATGAGCAGDDALTG